MADVADDTGPADALETARLGILFFLDNADKQIHTKWQSQSRIIATVASPVIDLYTPESLQARQTQDSALETRAYKNPFQVRDQAIIRQALADLLAPEADQPALIEDLKKGSGKPSTTSGITEAGSQYLQEQLAARGITVEEAHVKAGSTRGAPRIVSHADSVTGKKPADKVTRTRYQPVTADPDALDRAAIEKAKTFTLLFLDNARRIPQTREGRTLADIESSLSFITLQLRSQDGDARIVNYKNPFRISTKDRNIRAIVTQAVAELQEAVPALIAENPTVTTKTVDSLLQITNEGSSLVQAQLRSGDIGLTEVKQGTYGAQNITELLKERSKTGGQGTPGNAAI